MGRIAHLPCCERVAVDDAHAAQRLCRLLEHSARALGMSAPATVLCIGTDRSTGDALGPLVGTFLREQGFCGPVYGTLDEPVHAGNLEPLLREIRAREARGLLVAVDACLGRHDSVGSMTVGAGPLLPGAAVRKQLPPAGDLHLTGTVNVGGFMEYLVLQNTRLGLVVRMARTMALALSAAFS